MRIAVIPARGGSKRIPRKNIRNFAGMPMIAHSIGLLREMQVFKRIIVSTDDIEISEIAKRFGAETPFLRDPSISDEFSGLQTVIADVCERLSSEINSLDQVTCVLPCTPLLESDDLIKFLRISDENPESFVFPVTQLRANPARVLKRTSQQSFVFKNPEFRNTRTQDLEQLYADSGQFYIASASNWVSNQLDDFKCELLAPWKAVDIDNFEDWDLAERLFKFSQQKVILGNS
jgi:CMP-N-acetylneuraminic acid synthetase